MKHLFPTLALALLALTAPVAAWAAPGRPPAAARPAAEKVLVCMSPTSYAYHRSDACQGLGRCSHPVKAMSKAEAEQLGKRACRKCW